MTQGPEAGTLRALAKPLGVSYNWLSEGSPIEAEHSDIVMLAGSKVVHIQTKTGVVTDVEEMPRATPMMMTGPHFLTPQEWLLVSMHRRMDGEAQKDLLGYADDLPKVLNPPVASGETK